MKKKTAQQFGKFAAKKVMRPSKNNSSRRKEKRKKNGKSFLIKRKQKPVLNDQATIPGPYLQRLFTIAPYLLAQCPSTNL